MPDKVFISHSSKDKEIADAIRQHIEAAGVPCWIAPRDIEPGTDWTEGIMRGIAASRIFVLVFSGHANDSEHVRREVGQAFSLHLPVIPFRTENVAPRAGLKYFLESVHWLDATNPPVQQHFLTLTERVKALLSGEVASSPLEIVPEKDPPQSLRAATHRRKHWLAPIALLAGTAVIAGGVCFFIANNHKTDEGTLAHSVANISPKSIAVLPFESLSTDKEDTYFADGVQDDILNDVAKIAALTVISRTSVMQYRAGEKRDLRQIANALGVANVLEGTVRRNANRVRVSAELIDAHEDKSIWADSFDRDLTDIFAIQSEVAQTIAVKLAATLSPEEKRDIEKKPTENLAAYDLYLRAKELLAKASVDFNFADEQKTLLNAVSFLDQAVQLDPKFTLAYCKATYAHDLIYFLYDRSPERRALGDATIRSALALEPDLAEVHLAYAVHLYRTYHDYDRAREQLAIARRGLANDAEAFAIEAYMDRRQGNFPKAIQEFKDAIIRDPRNSPFVQNLAFTLYITREFPAAEQMYDRLIELRPGQPMVKVQKLLFVDYGKTGNDVALRQAVLELPASTPDDRGTLNLRLFLAFVDRDWVQVKELIQKMNGGEDNGDFAYATAAVPVGCYSILLARIQGEPVSGNPGFDEAREQLNQKVLKAPEDASLISQLAVVDALLNNKEKAIAEAKHAAELLPISKDAMEGAFITANLAVVYSWTNELGLAFETLSSLANGPGGIFYGTLKRDPYWEPLRQDPRYEKLLAELAPKE